MAHPTVAGFGHGARKPSAQHTTNRKGFLADGQGENGRSPSSIHKEVNSTSDPNEQETDASESPQEGTSYLQLSKTSELQTEIINLSCLGC